MTMEPFNYTKHWESMFFLVLERQSLFVSAAARLSIYIKTSLEVQREMPLLVRYREFPIYASVIANKG